MSLKKDLNILFLSDIHLGHPNNKTEYILESLDIFFNDFKNPSDLDGICIVGDLFDGLMDMGPGGSTEILLWMARLMEFCSKNDIKLRILEGTPSHDRHQSEKFLAVRAAQNASLDMKYVDRLHIEYVEDWGAHLLYIPDEWHADTSITYREVKELMAAKGIDKVDFALMHGYFDYQLPFGAHKIPHHDSERYLSIVEYFISIGHVHEFSFYKHIFAQGSFDRIAHGEENPKGAVRVEVKTTGEKEFFFIENKHARIYKTITLKNISMEATYKTIEKALKTVPAGSFIRLRAAKSHPVFSNMLEVALRFSDIRWSKKTLEEEKEEQNHSLLTDAIDSRYEAVIINENNILSLVRQNLEERAVNPIVLERALKRLTTFI